MYSSFLLDVSKMNDRGKWQKESKLQFVNYKLGQTHKLVWKHLDQGTKGRKSCEWVTDGNIGKQSMTNNGVMMSEFAIDS